MKTVYVIGAGASIGGSSKIRTTGFPTADGIICAIRQMLDRTGKQQPKALCAYLSRLFPCDSKASIVSELRKEWDNLNVEELYSALEFEARISDDLILPSGSGDEANPFYNFYYSESYRKYVQNLLKNDYYQHFEERYNLYSVSNAFPHLHQCFISLVKMELSNLISTLFYNLTANGEFDNFDELVNRFNEGDDIISYNYDLLLEGALKRKRPNDWCFQNGYALRPIGPHSKDRSPNFIFHGKNNAIVRSKFKIYKPHGSCNWHVLTTISKEPEIVLEAIGCTQIRKERFSGLVVTPDYELSSDFQHSQNEYIERLMIPPTPYKADYCFNGSYLHGPEEKIFMHNSLTGWQPQLMFHNSFHSLRKANRIIFIGFSMAPVDVPARLMFCGAAQINKNLESVSIVNPDQNAKIRIAQVFPGANEINCFDYFTELLKKG